MAFSYNCLALFQRKLSSEEQAVGTGQKIVLLPSMSSRASLHHLSIFNLHVFNSLEASSNSPGATSRESTPGLNSKAKRQKTASEESDESESKSTRYICSTVDLGLFVGISTLSCPRGLPLMRKSSDISQSKIKKLGMVHCRNFLLLGVPRVSWLSGSLAIV